MKANGNFYCNIGRVKRAACLARHSLLRDIGLITPVAGQQRYRSYFCEQVNVHNRLTFFLARRAVNAWGLRLKTFATLLTAVWDNQEPNARAR